MAYSNKPSLTDVPDKVIAVHEAVGAELNWRTSIAVDKGWLSDAEYSSISGAADPVARAQALLARAELRKMNDGGPRCSSCVHFARNPPGNRGRCALHKGPHSTIHGEYNVCERYT